MQTHGQAIVSRSGHAGPSVSVPTHLQGPLRRSDNVRTRSAGLARTRRATRAQPAPYIPAELERLLAGPLLEPAAPRLEHQAPLPGWDASPAGAAASLRRCCALLEARAACGEPVAAMLAHDPAFASYLDCAVAACGGEPKSLLQAFRVLGLVRTVEGTLLSGVHRRARAALAVACDTMVGTLEGHTIPVQHFPLTPEELVELTEAYAAMDIMRNGALAGAGMGHMLLVYALQKRISAQQLVRLFRAWNALGSRLGSLGMPSLHVYKAARASLVAALPSLSAVALLELVECQHGTSGAFGNWISWESFLLDVCQAAVLGTLAGSLTRREGAAVVEAAVQAASAKHRSLGSRLQAELEAWLAAEAPAMVVHETANNISVWEHTRSIADALSVAAVAAAVVLSYTA